MKQTPLYKRHVALGAKMVDFAGYQMPIQYTGIIQEHNAVRHSAGLFDVSHMGEFIITGDEAEVFLDYVTINDVVSIQPWQAQYSAMCYEDGGIIDDLLIYRYPDHFMLVVNASNKEKDFNWMLNHKPNDIIVDDISSSTSLVAVQGPKSKVALESLFNLSLDDLSFYSCKKIDIMIMIFL